ncbi:MAG: DUF2892 domain-containing protein [Gammaproteobacteria bacterium]|nr:DUF2892 domain-containing protein [Gammaproteobacteria bacterium]
MSESTYRMILGGSLILGLYFDLNYYLYVLVAVLMLESVSNILVPELFCLLANTIVLDGKKFEYTKDPCKPEYKININAERAWRFLVGFCVAISLYFYQQLWFFPWFMGFAIFGAGISGVCPMLLILRYIGFK